MRQVDSRSEHLSSKFIDSQVNSKKMLETSMNYCIILLHVIVIFYMSKEIVKLHSYYDRCFILVEC